jgi:hypothetical protein
MIPAIHSHGGATLGIGLICLLPLLCVLGIALSLF